MQSLQPVTPAQPAALAPPPRDDCFQSVVPDYALLFFDHLYSEYLALKFGINDAGTTDLLEGIQGKRLSKKLTWSDIYTFDLALVEIRPLENLIRKAYDARARYRSIAGQKEYDEYLASKPPDLTTILVAPNHNGGEAAEPELPNAPAQLPESAQIILRVLRADIKYLLSKFYLYYAMLPMREGLREQLTTRAVRMTKWILGTIAVLIVISFSVSALLKLFTSYGEIVGAIGELLGAFGPMVGSVAFAGIVGGCISMLQRIQSAPSEGDALFNLAALTNGWRGLSLSPFYGGIFSLVLFVVFAAGLFKGSVFPTVETNTITENVAAAQATRTPESQASEKSDTNNAAVKNSVPGDTHGPGVLKIKDFLRETGPKDGVSFALLMIWSFIAGFAERLVPDTLNRLVAKNEAIQGTNS